MQSEVKQEEAAMGGGALNIPAKKVHGTELKGPPFISKPEVVFFKVPGSADYTSWKKSISSKKLN